jgi:hypothetical protein
MSTNIVDLVPATRITLGSNTDTGLLTMKNIANGNYQQSAKIDLGATLHALYNVRLKNKFGSAPTAGNAMKLWIGFSNSATAGSDNSGNCTGADGAYTGYSGGTAAQSVLQLDFVGQLLLDANVGPQDGIIGSFTPRARYAYLVWQNASGQTTTNVDADHQVMIDPVDPRIEAAA